jgi:hypothetical protein
MSARLSPSILLSYQDTSNRLAEVAPLRNAGDHQIGDRIGDNLPAIRSDPVHDEQFVSGTQADDGTQRAVTNLIPKNE